MTEPNDPQDPLAEPLALINALLDNRLDADGVQRLEDMVKTRPEVCRLYIQYVHQECVMMPHRPAERAPWEEELTPTRSSFPMPIEQRGAVPARRPMIGRSVVLAAAAMLMLAFCVWMVFGGRAGTNPPVAIASIGALSDARWESAAGPIQTGMPITASTELRLQSGVAEVICTSGTKLLLEGPARVTVDTSSRLSLLSGKLTAHVPKEAIGFTVATPFATVVDLGTEFGVDVKPGVSTTVNVFVGRVQISTLKPDGTPARQVALTTGQAIETKGDRIVPVLTSPQRYIVSQANGSIARGPTLVPPTRVDLSAHFNRNGITDEGTPSIDSGLDGRGAVYAASLLTGLASEFDLSRTQGNNAVAALGQVVALAEKSFTAIEFVGAGINGKKPDVPFNIQYTDGTIQKYNTSLSNWNTPSQYPGETTAVTMDYRHGTLGERKPGAAFLYRYRLPLDPGKTVKSFTLPADKRGVVVLAVNLVP